MVNRFAAVAFACLVNLLLLGSVPALAAPPPA